jgi:putative tricarboxylic transport membrane protein
MMAAGFGVLGLVLKRLNLPIVPIILGMVLGGIMEVKLRAGMARVKTPFDFIDRPIAMILFLMILGVLFIHFRRVWLDRKAIKEAKWSTKHASTNFGMHLFRRKSYLLRERGRKVREKHLKYNPRSTDKR